VERGISDLEQPWWVAAIRLVTRTDEVDTAVDGGTSKSMCVCLCGILYTCPSVFALRRA